MTAYLLVLAGAAIGAPARYLIDRAVQARHPSLLPWGTLSVNVAGSLILGLIVGLDTRHALPAPVTLGVGVGFCGTLTTFSTFSYETVRVHESGARTRALLNVVAGVTTALGAVAIGYAVGSAT